MFANTPWDGFLRFRRSLRDSCKIVFYCRPSETSWGPFQRLSFLFVLDDTKVCMFGDFKPTRSCSCPCLQAEDDQDGKMAVAEAGYG